MLSFANFCMSFGHDDIFLHTYEADFIADLIQKKEHHLARSFYLSFSYKDDELLLNKSSLGKFIHRINPKELEIKDTTDIVKLASYLGLR